MSALDELTGLSASKRTREKVEAFFRRNQFPLVDGPNTTFVWRGQADHVNLRHWVYGLPSSQALTRIDGTDAVSYTHLTLPTNREV